MHLLIIGAGIGGLSTALMLAEQGISCSVLEQAPEIREVGVGINILPHAVKHLARLGLLGELEANAIPTGTLILANRFGQEVWREVRGAKAGYDVPQFSIHRGRLQKILLDAVRERVGDVVRVDHRLTGFVQADGAATALFETAQGPVTLQADGLIGADGIHSVVRKGLFPDQGPPLWSGVMMWRGARDWPKFLDGNSMTILGGRREKLVVYPIAPGTTEDTRLTNWVINIGIAAPGSPLPQSEDWSREGARQALLKRIDRFSSPLLDVRGLLESTPQFWEHPMCDRDALPFWSKDRVTLLGDAAHPMYPMGSNGAGQAILDAACLSRELGARKTVIDAFKAYEAERLPLTAEVVRRNRLGGPEMVIDRVEELAPDGFDDIEALLPYPERLRLSNEYAETAGFSQARVNA
ncbi:salicylate 1-monooxygenase [Hoeflea sp. BAL378]|uniref:flavin-dependent oxidoreductase n=1 Tax=Hoeflea sp. BAL378 TaxID=1547437 RepID=UPI000512B874|nr:flavin-dependent oxidoreductase [Hoeflea sp. BAL378]KGF69451.1 salicylate 1-monooxygenase [Hoeflea sp. BAL378]